MSFVLGVSGIQFIVGGMLFAAAVIVFALSISGESGPSTHANEYCVYPYICMTVALLYVILFSPAVSNDTEPNLVRSYKYSRSLDLNVYIIIVYIKLLGLNEMIYH